MHSASRVSSLTLVVMNLLPLQVCCHLLLLEASPFHSHFVHLDLFLLVLVCLFGYIFILSEQVSHYRTVLKHFVNDITAGRTVMTVEN